MKRDFGWMKRVFLFELGYSGPVLAQNNKVGVDPGILLQNAQNFRTQADVVEASRQGELLHWSELLDMSDNRSHDAAVVARMRCGALATEALRRR